MKAKRRHELQHNVLDSELGQLLGFFKRKGNQLAWGVLIIVAIVFAGVYLYRQSQAKKLQVQTEYSQYLQSRAPVDEQIEGFKTLAAQDTDERIAALSCVQIGSLSAKKMLTDTLTDDQRQTLADQADEYYRLVVNSFPQQKPAVAQARLGLGKLAEGRGEYAAAKEHYLAVETMSELTGQPVLAEAKASLKRLNSLKAPIRMSTSIPATAPATTSATTKPRED